MSEDDAEDAAEDAAAAPEEAEMEDEDTRTRERPLEEGALKERRNARDLPTDDMTERFLGALFGLSRSGLLSVLLFRVTPFSPGFSEGRTDFLEKISPWAWARAGRDGGEGVGWGSLTGLLSWSFTVHHQLRESTTRMRAQRREERKA